MIDLLRLKNLFDSSINDPSVTDMSNRVPSHMAPSPTMPNDATSPMIPRNDARMMDIFQPKTEMQDRFTSLLNEMPQREEPSTLRKIGAGLVGAFNGGEKGIAFREAPNTQKLADWKNKIDPALKGAQLEHDSNTNERIIHNNIMVNKLNQEKLEAKNANDQKRFELAEKKLKLTELKQNMPDLDFDFSGPVVLVADKKTGKVTNTGVETGSLSEMEKLVLGHKNKIEQIKTGGDESRKTEEVKQNNRIESEDQRSSNRTNDDWELGTVTDQETGKSHSVRINRSTGEIKAVDVKGVFTKPGTGNKPTANKPELPTQSRVRTANKAKELVARNPDWSKYITIKDNDVTVKMPTFRGDKATYDKIVSELYGTNTTVPGKDAKSTTPPDGTIKEFPNGNRGVWKGGKLYKLEAE